MNETHLLTKHRRIPVLPTRPRVHPITCKIYRSYPVGRLNFSRACQGKVLTVTITTEHPIPSYIQVNLVTDLNANERKAWDEVSFERVDDMTLVCHVIPKFPGLHTFRAEFSVDMGVSWIRDTVPDAWVLVDPPQVDGLRLYAMLPTISGTLADWKADLKRIAGMGFNAVHLLPITSLDVTESPYSAKDLFDIDPSYLVEGSREDSLAQLEEFIIEAKSLDIRLCFDLVLNHVGVQSRMTRLAPDWIVPDQNQPDGFHRAEYWSDQGRCTWDDLVLINYEHPSKQIRAEIWSYMIDYALFWAKYANDTGGFVRFDNLHESNVHFIQSVTFAMHAEYPEVGIIAEYFTDEHTLINTVPRWGLNLVLATPWNYKFVPQLREYLNYIHRDAEQVRYVMPVTSHDSGSPAQEFGSVEATIPRYVAAALLGTGATGSTQGVEYGEMEKINFIGRKPKKQFPAEARFAKFIGQVNSILADYPAFRNGKNCRFVDNDHSAIIAAFRRDTEAIDFGFLVACNFDIYHSQSITIDLTGDLGTGGTFPCSELLSGETHVFPSPRMTLSLPPCSAQVLRFPKSPAN